MTEKIHQTAIYEQSHGGQIREGEGGGAGKVGENALNAPGCHILVLCVPDLKAPALLSITLISNRLATSNDY